MCALRMCVLLTQAGRCSDGRGGGRSDECTRDETAGMYVCGICMWYMLCGMYVVYVMWYVCMWYMYVCMYVCGYVMWYMYVVYVMWYVCMWYMYVVYVMCRNTGPALMALPCRRLIRATRVLPCIW
jgi:hypothetical protein